MKAKSNLQTVSGQKSWRLATKTVEAFVTETGGHLGPVTFQVGKHSIQPFHIAPWCEEKEAKSLPAILRVLRGDFFCLPFGGNARRWGKEQHPIHGETANNPWACEAFLDEQGTRCLHLSLETKVRRGMVDKIIFLREGHQAVYSRHVIMSMSGPMNFGHHAMLRFPEEPGSGIVATSRFVHGQVFPGQFEDPAQGGYTSLQPGAVFKSLQKVPLAHGGTADLTRYPARRGFEDLVMMVADPKLPFAWTTVTFPRQRYVWFALKDPRVLSGTIFWLSNGGRHYPPWNGRHVNVMGLEEVTSNFHYGLAESVAPNPLSRQGHPTRVMLRSEDPLIVSYIMGVAAIPAGFDGVRAIERTKSGIVLQARSGRQARADVAMEFLE